jgi:hypothetical protein
VQACGKDSSQASRVLDGLLPTLESSILTTHRCKYVQFVLFYLAARDPTHVAPRLVRPRMDGPSWIAIAGGGAC